MNILKTLKWAGSVVVLVLMGMVVWLSWSTLTGDGVTLLWEGSSADAKILFFGMIWAAVIIGSND